MPSGDAAKSLAGLQEVLTALLGANGCPWDKKQTPESLCDYIIEEAFELVEAVRRGDVPETAEELGDVAFLLLFLAEIHARRGDFDLATALEGAREKMVRRHPHVFADTDVADDTEVKSNWEAIKRKEKSAARSPSGVFASLPPGLPPMLKAYRLHSKAARNGFTWESDADLAGQLASEWEEWRTARDSGDADRMEAEFGDYLFTLVEYGRRHGIRANAALARTNETFLARFARMEALARESGRQVADMGPAELDTLWETAKRLENEES